jgi:NADPH2:quinone reductase
MKAIRISETGGPEVLRPVDLPTPAPGPGQALVRVEAAGVNFIDIYQRSGLYKVPLPFTIGLEGAGTVESVAAGVTTVDPGDRVAWTGVPGAYATHALVPVDRLVRLPDSLSTRDASAAMLQGMTAHYLAVDTCPLRPGDICLVHAAAGGVGLLLCQIAKRRGARVVGTVSTEAKAALAREAGADDTILYTRQDFVAEVKRITGGKGLRVVFDGVGRDTFEKGLDCLQPRGMMVLFGQSSGPVPPVDAQVLSAKGSLFLTRPTLFHYIATREELDQRSRDVLGWIAEGTLKLRIDRTYPLAEAAEAHRALAGRGTTGKLLLLPTE